MAGFAEAILLRRKYAVMKDAAGRPAPTADDDAVSPSHAPPAALAFGHARGSTSTRRRAPERIQHYR